MSTAPVDTSELTWNDVRRNVAQLCKNRGWHHGVPIMSATDPSRRVVLAKGAPLSAEKGHGVPISLTGETEPSEADDSTITNMWRTKPKLVAAVREGGKCYAEYCDDSEERFQLLVKSLLCQAGAVSVEAEFNAMASLFKRINENQRECYVLAGAFPETSEKSGVTYIFRKGLPTIAMRCTPRENAPEKRQFLAALCCHPLGYYHGTHVGCCPPSDEVLSHLLMMRGDEHAFWRRSNQHAIDDPLAAI